MENIALAIREILNEVSVMSMMIGGRLRNTDADVPAYLRDENDIVIYYSYGSFRIDKDLIFLKIRIPDSRFAEASDLCLDNFNIIKEFSNRESLSGDGVIFEITFHNKHRLDLTFEVIKSILVLLI